MKLDLNSIFNRQSEGWGCRTVSTVFSLKMNAGSDVSMQRNCHASETFASASTEPRKLSFHIKVQFTSVVVALVFIDCYHCAQYIIINNYIKDTIKISSQKIKSSITPQMTKKCDFSYNWRIVHIVQVICSNMNKGVKD